jgi:hypothetical protein
LATSCPVPGSLISEEDEEEAEPVLILYEDHARIVQATNAIS